MTARVSQAGEVTAWRMPFSGSSLFQVAAGASGVSYVNGDSDAGAVFLGRLDTERGEFREIQIPFNAGTADLRVRPADGTAFLTDSSTGELGQVDVKTREFRRWALPDGGYIRSFVFDDTGAVLFLAQTMPEARMLIGRLDIETGAVSMWPFPDSMALPGEDFAWRIVRAPDGTVVVNVNGFAHPGQMVRLDLATGVFTSWQTPAAPVFPLVADAAGSIYFQEIAGGVRRVARLVPATSQLTEWNVPIPDVEFAGEMALESGRLLFGIYIPSNGLAALDPSAAGDESAPVPFVEAPVAPSTAVLSPPVVTRMRSRVGHARPVVSTVPATALGAFTTWDFGPGFVAVGSGTGSGAIYGPADVGGLSIMKFVP